MIRAKRAISLLISLLLLLSLCSCSILFPMDEKDIRNKHYNEMAEYLSNNTSLKIVKIRDHEYNEDLKSISLYVTLPYKAQVSLKQLDELRIELTEYLQRDGEYLEEGWQVAVSVYDDSRNTGNGTWYARFANFERGYLYHGCQERYETTDNLNTFHFEFAEEDISYISSLTDVEYMFICGSYSETDTEWIDKTISEIRELDNLKTLKLYSDWYEPFSNADLGCEIIEVEAGDYYGTLVVH